MSSTSHISWLVAVVVLLCAGAAFSESELNEDVVESEKMKVRPARSAVGETGPEVFHNGAVGDEYMIALMQNEGSILKSIEKELSNEIFVTSASNQSLVVDLISPGLDLYKTYNVPGTQVVCINVIHIAHMVGSSRSMKGADSSGIQIDGISIQSVVQWKSLEYVTDYVGAILHISSGTLTVTHINPLCNFGLILCSTADRKSVCFPLVLKLPILTECEETIMVVEDDGIDNDCDKYTDEEICDGFDDDGDGRVDEDCKSTTDTTTTTLSYTSTTTETLTTVAPSAPEPDVGEGYVSLEIDVRPDVVTGCSLTSAHSTTS